MKIIKLSKYFLILTFLYNSKILAYDFLDLCANNYLPQVREHLNKGGNVNLQDEFGATCLMRAVLNNNYGLAKYLLENKALADIRDAAGVTALNMASRENLSQIIELLLQYNADPNVIDNFGFFPLMHSVKNNNKHAFKMLLDKTESDVLNNYNRFDQNIFQIAIKRSDIEMLSDLLDKNPAIEVEELVKYSKQLNNLVIASYLEDKNKILRSRKIAQEIKEKFDDESIIQEFSQSEKDKKIDSNNINYIIKENTNKKVPQTKSNVVKNTKPKSIIIPNKNEELEKTMPDFDKEIEILTEELMLNKPTEEILDLQKLDIPNSFSNENISSNKNDKKDKLKGIIFSLKPTDYRKPAKQGLLKLK